MILKNERKNLFFKTNLIFKFEINLNTKNLKKKEITLNIKNV